jgi:hypothetical protein
MPLLFFIVIMALLLGSLPTWPHSREWGYYPSSGFGLVLVVLVVLAVTHRL